LNIFSKFDENELFEKKIPKNGYNPFQEAKKIENINEGEIIEDEQNSGNENNKLDMIHMNVIRNFQNYSDEKAEEQ
jgi:hypothetical protein